MKVTTTKQSIVVFDRVLEAMKQAGKRKSSTRDTDYDHPAKLGGKMLERMSRGEWVTLEDLARVYDGHPNTSSDRIKRSRSYLGTIRKFSKKAGVWQQRSDGTFRIWQ